MKTKKYLLVIFAVATLLFSTYVGYEYMRYRKYTSSRIEGNLPFIFQGIDRYFDRYVIIPSPEELYKDLINDSEFNIRYPQIYKMIPELNMRDFTFVEKPFLTVDVWMFSDKPKTKDTIRLSNASFFDFFFKKSIYITTVCVAHPCSGELFMLLDKNNKRIKETTTARKNFVMAAVKVLKTVRQLTVIDSVRFNCYCMYNDGERLMVEDPYSKNAVVEPIIKNLMLDNFTPLFEKYTPRYERLKLYIYIY